MEGQGGLWGLDIEEGVLKEDFSGRSWAVKVVPLDEIQAEQKAQKDAKKDAEDTDNEQLLLRQLDTWKDGQAEWPTRSKLKRSLSWDSDKYSRISDRLVRKKVIEEFLGKAVIGNGAGRDAVFVRRLNMGT